MGTTSSCMINIRIPHELLAAVKAKAAELGVPYQTFMKHCIEEGLRRAKDEGWVPTLPERGRSFNGAHAPQTSARALVYFLQTMAPSRLIKIGVSTNVPARVKEFQSGHPAPLVMLHTMPGTMAMERSLHVAFAHLRQVGEWFTPAPELLAFIEARKAEAQPLGVGTPVHTDPVVVPPPPEEPGVHTSEVHTPPDLVAEEEPQQPEAAHEEEGSHAPGREPVTAEPPPQEEETPWDFLDSV